MQLASDLDLFELDWHNPEFSANPFPHFERARKTHPWLAKVDGGYAIFEMKAIRDLLGNDDNLRTPFDTIAEMMECRGSPWGRFCEEQMIAMTGREHRLMRDTFAPRFTPRFANQLRPIMRRTMQRLLDDWVPREKIDFGEFASYYPVAVAAEMVGAPQSVIPGLKDSMETMGVAFALDKSKVPALDKAFLHMDAFARDLIAERREIPLADGEIDLLQLLIDVSDKGEITERQLTDLLIFIFVAGYDTSKNALTYAMHLMLDNPEIYERCADDLHYCQRVVEETLRMGNPGFGFRMVKKDIEYRGVRIPTGTMLFFTLSIAGRDTTAFEDPDIYDPERPIVPSRRQVAFGLGKHMCLGQYIARAQIQEGIHLIAQHMKNPRRDGASGWRPFPGTWGVDGLPIAFTPA